MVTSLPLIHFQLLVDLGSRTAPNQYCLIIQRNVYTNYFEIKIKVNTRRCNRDIIRQSLDILVHVQLHLSCSALVKYNAN